ncbi:IclR family transcriptional regulator [Rummeliibacillus suwonensis]|uniref:IclR family transcriptional regulator n=1 Tax=Rummeliibacillus suwonensis TaxID=1306154 RepID=UPI0011B7FB50|nr:IclR family transcriptional regulator [Rummeliibacillus suwonensis]MBO2537428.1 IclR family transcriptional regulator [Rummeliibacillus suwonensis]
MDTLNKTVLKSMTILKLFLEYEKLNLNQMIELTNLPKTSVYRMVSSLEVIGFLNKDDNGFYKLGLIFLQFGELVSERLDLRKIAFPILEKLRDEVDEAVNLSSKDGTESVYIEKLDTNHPVRLYTRIGRRSPLYVGACSRIILAYLTEKEQEKYLEETKLKSFCSGTITDKEELKKILVQSYKDGYTISHSELAEQTFEIAAPIFDHTGKVLASLSIAGAESRLLKDDMDFLISKVVAAGMEISCELGYKKEVSNSIK